MSALAAPRFAPFTSFLDFQRQLQLQIAADLDALFAATDLPKPLIDACRYVMSNQGKLVRPLLVAAAFVSTSHEDSFETPTLSADPADNKNSAETKRLNQVNDQLEVQSHIDMCRRAALAVELLHTYSLVHDDLPCMDDDALRRGQPTAHVAFDEATALLAGDVLQTLAFEVLTIKLPNFAPFNPLIAGELLAVFAPRARRMVAGQMLDLNAEAKANISQNELEAIHCDKTGALIEAAMLMGAICGNATAPERIALQDSAQHIGLAFQVQDDILDVTMSTDALGKPAGSDEKLDKSTYVKLMGIDAASHYAQSLFDQGRHAITTTLKDNPNHKALLELIDWLWARQK